MWLYNNNRGQSLIEAIIAMAIFVLISAVLISMTIGGQMASSHGGDYLTAEALATEGIEAVRSIYDRAWNERIYDKSAITASSTGYWIFSGEGTEEEIGKFKRAISFEDICRDNSDNIVDCPGDYNDPHTQKVIVRVEWEVDGGGITSISRTTYLTNWDSNIWKQTNWVGGAGQSIWSDETKYDSDNAKINVATAGQVGLNYTTHTTASNNWTFSNVGNYVYDTSKIELVDGYAQLKGTGGAGASGNSVDDGFEFTQATSYDWPFTTPGNYLYDASKIEVTGGLAQLKATIGGVVTGGTLNNTFDVDASNWSFSTWDYQAGEVTPTGSRLSTGGNPNGYININIPFNAKNQMVGGYWTQPFTVTGSNINSTCSFDWRITNWYAQNNTLDDLRVYVFLDSSSGAPVIGQEVWSSAKITATTPWSTTVTVDCSGKTLTAGTYYFKLAFWLDAANKNAGPMTVGFDNAKVDWTSSTVSYPTDKPTIYPASSYPALGVWSWSSFTETAVKNGGEIYYQLSSDNGSTWRYWNGASWATAGSLNYNTASVINTNIQDFSTSSEQILFKAFLSSNGSQQVKLDNINLGLTPHNVWSFGVYDIDGGEVTPTGSRETSGGNPGKFAQITVPSGSGDEIGAYWQQPVNIGVDNPLIDVDFDYKVIDYNGTPITAEAQVFLDKFPGDPVNQFGDSTVLTAEGGWLSNPTISLSNIATTSGIYYLKIAFWVETPTGGGAGPFVVGFDNVNLSWQATGYSTDKPTIRNKISFQPTNISNWASFIEVSTSTGGEIYYQLSSDDGANWQYWNGSAWVVDPDGAEGLDENDYNSAIQVNNYINLFSTSTKKLMFKAFLVSDGSTQVKLDNIEAVLDITSVGYEGNLLKIDTVLGAGELSKTTSRTSLRFTAKDSKTVDFLKIYLEQLKGTSPVYRIGLQSDNLGNPSGVWLGSTGQGYAYHQATTTGWQTIYLNENVSLEEDETYHLVVAYQSGTIGGGSMIELRASDPNNFISPYDSSPNLSSNVLSSGDNGTSWTVLGYQPIYVLGFTDKSLGGNPYQSRQVRDVYGSNYVGERLTLNHEIPISEIGVLVSENNEAPLGKLYVNLYDVSNSILLASGTIATADTATIKSYKWMTYKFPTEITLASGTTYQIILFSPQSTLQKHYRIYSVFNDSNPKLNGINYGGENAYFINSTNAGASWTPYLNHDYGGFRFGKLIYEGSGYFVSSAYNTGTSSVFDVIEWDQITPKCSPACEVKFQIQTAPDNGGIPGVWSPTWSGPEGEDGDEVDYFSSADGEIIHFNHNGDQWIRYKALLTGDTSATPLLQEVRIFYQ